MNGITNVNIVEELYLGIINDYNQVITILNQCKALINGNMLSGELRSYFNQLGSANEISTDTIQLVNECQNIQIKIKTSIELCNSMDEDMKWQLESLINEIFTDETISSTEYMGATYDERVKYVNSLIASSEQVLVQLEEAYKATFGNGIKMDSEKAECFVNLLTAVGVFEINTANKDDKSLLDKVYSETLYNDAKGCFNIEQLGYIIDFCNENGVVSSLREYVVNGKSWEESGLEDLFGYNLKLTTHGWMYGNGINVDDYTSLDAESIFIQKYIDLYCDEGVQKFSDIIYNFNEKTGYGYNLYDLGYDGENPFWFRNINDKEYMVELLKNQVKLNDIFVMYDEVQSLHTKCLGQYEEIQTLKNSVYNFKQYAMLMPFEPYMKEEEYLNNYLSKDYSNYSHKEISNKWIKYLTVDEIAMFDYVYNEKSQYEAKEYLLAIEDRINQRIGFERMADFADSLNKEHDLGKEQAQLLSMLGSTGPGGMVVSSSLLLIDNLFPDFYDYLVDVGIVTTEGFIDGNYNFIDGLSDFIYADGKRDAKDYEMIYKMQLLMGEKIQMSTGDGIYEVELSDEFSEFQKKSYEVLYQYGNSIGSMAIPILVSYIPVVGSGLSLTLRSASSIGNSRENLMQQGLDKNSAYIYGAFLGLSETVIEQIIGGLPGSSRVVSKSWIQQLKSIVGESCEEIIQTYISAGITSMATGEPIDLTSLTGEALEAGLMAIATTVTLNGGGKVLVKMSDLVLEINNTEINSQTV